MSLTLTPWRPGAPADFQQLALLLHDVVYDRASVGFIIPFSLENALTFWSNVASAVQAGSRTVLLARLDGHIVGTVQLDIDTPPNQPHRAEIKKLLVHPTARRRGIARALMLAIEQLALSLGRTLLVLDTATGDKAEPLYHSLGYTPLGIIPAFALDSTASRLEATTFFYKHLTPPAIA